MPAVTRSECSKTSSTLVDRLLPAGLLALLGAAAIGLTAYLMSWSGGSLAEAFVAVPAPNPVVDNIAGGQPLKCTMDSIDGSEPVNRRFVVPPARVAIRGWLVDTRNWTRPNPAMLRLEGAAESQVFEFEIGDGKSRGDVANYFKQPGVAMAGFESTVDLSQVPLGIYDVSLALPLGGEQCIKGLSLEVRR